jgi:hypothetical protein
MATIAEMFVNIGANTDGFEREIGQMERQFNRMSRDMQRGTRAINREFENLTPQARETFTRMRTDMEASREGMRDFQRQQMEVQAAFYDLTSAAGDFSDSNGDYIQALTDLGNRQRQITEQMQANNRFAVNSFHRMVGTMLARSTQSSSIASNFDRMNNPLYRVNNSLLRVSGSMERLAMQGQPAALALRMLGPTANMRQLQSQVRLITAGLMRFQAVALVAAVASAILYTALFRAASGPDVSEVYNKQAELLANYEQEVRAKTESIMEAWNIFEKVELKGPNPNTLIQNLADQLTIIQGWRINLDKILARTGDSVFTDYLADLGPEAAGEIQVLSQMTDAELSKYVDLWRQKTIHARLEAEDQLTILKQNTDKKVKELQDSLTPLGLALEPMKAAWAGAFQPMVDAFTMVAVPIANFLTTIGEMITKFNEAHPTLALIIQGFLMLIPALFLILSPLAIGIGLWGGLIAAWGLVAPIIMPLISGFAAMAGTVAIVAAVIVGLVAGFMYLWNTSEGFRNALITGWEAIKNAATAIWEFIYNSILVPIINAIVTFVKDQLDKIKDFWDENGAIITQLVDTYFSAIKVYIALIMGIIKTIFQTVWPIISGIVQVAWAMMKTIVDTAINLILGIIQTVLKLIQGDWEGAWNTIKTTAETIMNNIVGFFEGIDLYQIGKDIIQGLINGIGSMVKNVGDKVKELADKIPEGIKKFLGIHSPSRVLMELGEFTGEGFAKGIGSTISAISGMSLNMASAAIPTPQELSYGAATPAQTTAPISITLHYNGNASKEDVYQMVDVLENEFVTRFNSAMRLGGNKE